MATLGEARGQLLDQVDADPAPSTDYVRRVNGFLDRAVQMLSREAPYLFFEGEHWLKLEPPVEPTLSTDTVDVHTSNSVDFHELLVTDLAIGTTGRQAWTDDRTWDGRDIELLDTSSGDIVHRSRIKTIRNGSTYTHISLETPVPGGLSGPWDWRVHTRVHWLPDDVIEWRSAHIADRQNMHEIKVITQGEAEERWFINDHDATASGYPRYAYRRGNFSLRPPARAPLVAEGDDTVAAERWYGPEPGGKFTYAFTYSWGKRDEQHHGIPHYDYDSEVYDVEDRFAADDTFWLEEASKNRVKVPRWESAPSPISDAITTEVMDDAADWAGAIKLTFPNIAYAMGNFFQGLDAGAGFGRTEASGMSGLHIRIYRRRWTEDLTNYNSLGGLTKTSGASITDFATTTAMGRMEFDDSYYLLAEIPIELATAGVFWDRGRITPDYSVRMPEVTGYQGVRFYPVPDSDYDIVLRCLKRPRRLENDQDVLPVPSDATDVVIYKAMTMYYEHMREPAMADRARVLYEEQINSLGKRYGNLHPGHKAFFRRMARTGIYSGRRYVGWRRYEE